MKAGSVGIEVDVHLTEAEILNLEKNFLFGIMKFWEVNGRGFKEIPIEISYSRRQKEFLEVTQTPRGIYFGEASKIQFSINKYLYEMLKEYDSCGDRFSMGGKFIIYKIK